ncbi:hypothetical protein NC652_000041 [Populus alba x Populus x berolinensis]|nr:hypothetical protein NC652_000041 [Populus alba x Populus x berolinensis]
MGFSQDNLKGFVLALSSSVGGFSYLFRATMVVGHDSQNISFCMVSHIVIVGEVANFAAYAFAPAVLVTPLGALSIIVSAVLAHFILNEKLHQLGILGCVMCIAGSIVIVIHAPQERPITSVQEIWSMATQPDFLLYVGSVIVLVFIMIFHFAPQCGHSNVLVFTGICSFMGSLSVKSSEPAMVLLFSIIRPNLWM